MESSWCQQSKKVLHFHRSNHNAGNNDGKQDFLQPHLGHNASFVCCARHAEHSQERNTEQSCTLHTTLLQVVREDCTPLVERSDVVVLNTSLGMSLETHYQAYSESKSHGHCQGHSHEHEKKKTEAQAKPKEMEKK